MIFDTLDNAAAYESACPGLAEAVKLARRIDPTQPDVKYDIGGEKMYAIVSSYETLPAETMPFEGHRKYIDVQIILDGEERIDVAANRDLSVIEAYCEDRDVTFFAAPSTYSTLALTPGSFAVFFPSDAHRPGCSITRPAEIHKLVVKIRVPDEA